MGVRGGTRSSLRGRRWLLASAGQCGSAEGPYGQSLVVSTVYRWGPSCPTQQPTPCPLGPVLAVLLRQRLARHSLVACKRFERQAGELPSNSTPVLFPPLCFYQSGHCKWWSEGSHLKPLQARCTYRPPSLSIDPTLVGQSTDWAETVDRNNSVGPFGQLCPKLFFYNRRI